MPRDHPRQEDPFHRINKWDDGYEYIRDAMPSQPAGREPAPFYSPPPRTSRPERPAAHEHGFRRKPARKDDEPPVRRPYPSPPSESDAHTRRRRRSPSPGRRQRGVDGGWDRDRSASNAPPPRLHTRSPSPPRQRDRDNWDGTPNRRDRHHSPSPGRAASIRHRDANRRGRSPSPPPSRDQQPRRSARHPSPSPRRKEGLPRYPTHRPTISRSKTAAARDRLAGLSPRWQQAATAAFQAGSMAALNARTQPGAWKGEKGARVATAALGAAAMDAFVKKTVDAGGAGPKPNVEAFGDAFGEFLADQFAKRHTKEGRSSKGRRH